MSKILTVVSCGPVQQVTSQRAEGGLTTKRSMLLQELGGKFENQYVATQLGPGTSIALAPGDLVAAKLQMRFHDYNGQIYQDVMVNELVLLKKNDDNL